MLTGNYRSPLTPECMPSARSFISLIFGGFLAAFILAAIDFGAHFGIDRAKVLYGSFPMEDKRFWWALGLDQAAHHLCGFLIISVLHFL